MIHLAGQEVQHFLDWLTAQELTAEPCQLVFLPGYDTIGGDPENPPEGFACYLPVLRVIFCPDLQPLVESGNLTEAERVEQVLTNIAHEYVHHVQHSEGRETEEDEAHQRAGELVVRYRAEGRLPS